MYSIELVCNTSYRILDIGCWVLHIELELQSVECILSKIQEDRENRATWRSIYAETDDSPLTGGEVCRFLH